MFPRDAKPGSQSVSEQWEVGWPWYLASNRNFIVAQIDGGGSGFQGEKMRRAIQYGYVKVFYYRITGFVVDSLVDNNRSWLYFYELS